MLKKLTFALAALALSAAGALAASTTLPLPSVPGPSLGDPVSNLYTFMQAYQASSGWGAVDLGSISQTSGQANCTQIGPNNISALHRATTSAATGYVCLPTAYPGKIIYIANSTGQTIDIYSNATSYVPGTADKINGTAGTTPFTGLTSSNAFVTCFTPVGGYWYCSATSNGAAGPGSFTTLASSGLYTASGHIAASTTAPTLTSCGSSPSITGSDTAGVVTVKTTSCTISFATAYATAPVCVVVDETTPSTSMAYTVSTAAITISAGLTSSDKVMYLCIGQSGG